MPPENSCRVLIIGLDGASPDLIADWAAAGALPNLSRLIRQGTWGTLRSTLPPVTAPAWVSFMTGKNPGRHGVFNFRNLDLRSYGGTGPQAAVASSATYAGCSIFELVSAAGGRVASLNVPVTYPPFPVNGVMISGLPLVPDYRRAYTYPPELAQSIGPWSLHRKTVEELSARQRLEAMDFWTKKHTEVSLDLLAKGPWDLFALVLRNTDEVPHYFWKYTDPGYHGFDPRGSEEYGDVIKTEYRKADAAVGRLLAAAGENTVVLVLSDHGSGAHPGRCFHVNRWLAELNMLTPKDGNGKGPTLAGSLARLKAHVPQRARISLSSFLRSHLPSGAQERVFRILQNVDRIDWRGTLAYRVPLFPMVDGIELNVRGRQPQGIVELGGEYEALRGRLIHELTRLRDPVTGQPVVESVYRREEAYQGPYVSQAPDLLVLFQPTCTGGPGLYGPTFTDYDESLNHWSGAHRMDGVFIGCGEPIRSGAELQTARIEDVAPTVLYTLGLPVPEDMDGRILTELFTHEYLGAHPQRRTCYSQAPPERQALTTEEEEELGRHLKALGYL